MVDTIATGGGQELSPEMLKIMKASMKKDRWAPLELAD